jgi:hypothetical protein
MSPRNQITKFSIEGPSMLIIRYSLFGAQGKLDETPNIDHRDNLKSRINYIEQRWPATPIDFTNAI